VSCRGNLRSAEQSLLFDFLTARGAFGVLKKLQVAAAGIGAANQ
jgi:hypothetical protein